MSKFFFNDSERRQAAAAQECRRAQERANAQCENAGQSNLSGSMAGYDMYNQGRACTAAQNAANAACQGQKKR